MSVRAGREFLAIPGPTTVPDEVLRAMHRPAVDIYSGPLLALTDSLLKDVARVFNTTGRAYIYISNGHGAWEASLTNVLSKGDRILDLVPGIHFDAVIDLSSAAAGAINMKGSGVVPVNVAVLGRSAVTAAGPADDLEAFADAVLARTLPPSGLGDDVCLRAVRRLP